MAGTADIDALGHVIADAFHELPQSEWLIPDARARRQILPGYFGLLVEEAIAGGTAHTTPDRAAVALWLPVTAEPAAQTTGYAARLTAVTERWADRFAAFDAVLDRNRPRGVAYHHLAILAVTPARQDTGLGSALLRAYHEILDREGALAYLEAAGLRSRQLYQRHGYLPSGAIPLPEDGPMMWPMARPSFDRWPASIALEPTATAATPTGLSGKVPRPRKELDTGP